MSSYYENSKNKFFFRIRLHKKKISEVDCCSSAANISTLISSCETKPKKEGYSDILPLWKQTKNNRKETEEKKRIETKTKYVQAIYYKKINDKHHIL